MLGYSPAMHKHATLMLAVLLCGTSLTAGSARAQASTPNAVPPPRSAHPPVLLPMPDADLRAAFEAAARGTLDPATLERHRAQPLHFDAAMRPCQRAHAVGRVHAAAVYAGLFERA